jgi:uncharacterized protein
MSALARAIIVLAALLAAAPAVAMTQDIALRRYEARTIVTGTDLRSRPAGLATCLTDVLIKVSGDPTLADDPRVAALLPRAGDFVADFDYWDRMSGMPLHDEQGSYDRPFMFTVRFVPERIDAALHAIGRAPWPDPRAAIVPLIQVDSATGAFELTATEPRAEGMRAALAESGQRYGMVVVVPPPPLPTPSSVADGPGQIALVGSLTLSAAALGWVGSWHLDWHGRSYDWGESGVNYDEAFRQAVRGAMRIASGHGAP